MLALISPDEAIKLADDLSTKSDRWLMIAILVFFFCTIILIVRWFMTQLDRRDRKIDELGAKLDAVQAEQTTYLRTSVEKLSNVVAANTQAILVQSEQTRTLLIQTHRGSGH